MLGHVDYEQLRTLCLSMPGAFEDFPFGPEFAVYKVRGRTDGPAKVFALLRQNDDGTRINLKCEPVLAEQLRAAHPEIVPGYHMSKKHWNTVSADGALDPDMFHDLIQDSWDLVVDSLPVADRTALGWKRLTGRG